MEPPPPFKLTRESKIRIDREGHFWHEGERVVHEGLARGMASWIALDPETDRYILRNSMDWCFITVDDTPFFVESVVTGPDGLPLLLLSDGTTEPLDAKSVRVDAEDVPYCDVKNGVFPARFSRSAAFALLERAHADRDGFVLALPSGEYPIRRVAEGARKRAPTRPD